MPIKTVTQLDDQLKSRLITIWRSSVSATHDFLSAEEIEQIQGDLEKGLQHYPLFLIAYVDDRPVGFAAVYQQKLEMLFINDDYRRQGIGRQLVARAITDYHVTTTTVNEQNPSALGFYQHLGFVIYKRTDRDEQGRPYPILFMKLSEVPFVITLVKQNGHQIAIVEDEKVVIDDVPSALDLIIAVNHQYDTNRVAISKDALAESFFDLSTGLAGEILQKFVNYQTKLAIWGDFSEYKSKPLQDFIYESNKGEQIFFAPSRREAIVKLGAAQVRESQVVLLR